MDDALRVGMPLLIAAAAALFSGLVARLLRGATGLRRGLQQDAAVVETLRGAPQEELREDMGHRAFRLVALSQNPLFIGPDVVGGLVALTVIGAGLLSIYPGGTLSDRSYFDFEAFVGVVAPVLLLAQPIWHFILRGWSRRTIARLEYLRPHLPADTVDDILLSARLATTGLKVVATLLHIGSLVAGWLGLVLALHQPALIEKIMAGAALMFVLLGVVSLRRLSHTEELDRLLPRLSYMMGAEAVLQEHPKSSDDDGQDTVRDDRRPTAASNLEATPSKSESNSSA